MSDKLTLDFVDSKVDSFAAACSTLAQQGKKTILLRPFDHFAVEVLDRARAQGVSATFYVHEHECEVPLDNKDVSLAEEDNPVDATILLSQNPETLSAYLMEYFDLEQGAIVAPITDWYFKNKPLFLISIPKSGTHLLYRLAEAFGYGRGLVGRDSPSPGSWYCIEYTNSHTSARDFFIDTVRRSPFGNRLHPFPKSPAIFIYRNPLDIVVSEANYYHKDGNTAFYGYLSGLSFEKRLLKLIDDPWLLGSIRDRVGNFIAWLDFPNVIPISFEELVGPKGGGSREAQIKLIWSLQLKLHIPGNPCDFGDSIFGGSSATFHKGQIGSYRDCFTEEAYERFYALPQDFMAALGYDFDHRNEFRIIPRRAEEFRRRPISFSKADFDDIPIEIDANYMGHYIVKYRGRFYGIPYGAEVGNLNEESERVLKALPSATDLCALRQRIGFEDGLNRTSLRRRALARLSKFVPYRIKKAWRSRR